MTTEYPLALYHAYHTGNRGDMCFYEDACVGASTVLELGSGIGRIQRPLAAAGYDVIGLESDHRAVSMANAHGLNTLQGDMRRFRLEQKFDRILIPYNGLYCLASEDDQIACLSCAAEHLNDDGRLIFDLYSGDALDFTQALHKPSRPELVGEVIVDDERWSVLESTEWDPPHQQMTVSYIYTAQSSGEHAFGVIHHRYLHSEEVPELLESAGLFLEALRGDFDESPFTQESDFMIVTASLE